MATYLIDTGQYVVSNYPPGTGLFSAPFYLFSPKTLPSSDQWTIFSFLGIDEPVDLPLVPGLPSALAAGFYTALGVTGLFVALTWSGVGRREALAASALVGFGTGAFSVAADAMWQHSVAVAFIGLFLALVARNHLVWAGIAAAAAVLTRPPTAFAVAVVGLYIAWRRSSLRPVFAIGIPTSLGALGYVWHQLYYFGEITRIGYVTAAVSGGVIDDLAGAGLALFDPQRGLFVLTPVALVALFYVPPVWRAAPDWVKGAAIGALVLFAFQMRGNAWDGGSGFFGYRYMIEPLFFAAPLLVLGGIHAWEKGGLSRALLVVSGVVSVAVHTYGAALPWVLPTIS